jgi:nucleotide-binding universal stress UspA family protein
MEYVADELALEARTALARGAVAAAPLHPTETAFHEGDPFSCLLAEIERRRATLLVVGSHGRSRATGLAFGSVGTRLLRDAPCSVLVARPPMETLWPRSIVVGLDGSRESAVASAAARDLARRLRTRLRFVAATGEANVHLTAAYRIAEEIEEHFGSAVRELHRLSFGTDLVVVGSRGLRGLESLGSVSERIAHEAHCSVLVVRTPR